MSKDDDRSELERGQLALVQWQKQSTESDEKVLIIFEVRDAADGPTAIQECATFRPDLILLDIMMPGMDGFETATQIKRHAKSRDVPIIFLTAATMQPEQAFRGYAAGAVDYLAKPFDPWVLKSKVSVFVDLYLKRDEVGAQHPVLDQLSATLGAVEETLALLRKLPAVLRDAEAKETAAQLAGRVGRLREALEAFGSGAT